MTPQEINEAVFKKLGNRFAGEGPHLHGDQKPCYHYIPDYCGSISAAWEILEHLKIPWYVAQQEVKLVSKEYAYKDGLCAPFKCSLNNGDKYWISAEADTAPMAICLAFLKLT